MYVGKQKSADIGGGLVFVFVFCICICICILMQGVVEGELGVCW